MTNISKNIDNQRDYVKIDNGDFMEKNKKYGQLLLFFFGVVLATLFFQYPNFKFGLDNVNAYQQFSYGLVSDTLEVNAYFGAVQNNYGGADVKLESQEKSLKAQVTLEDGTKLEHLLKLKDENYYVMDVVATTSKSKPRQIEIYAQDGKTLAQGELKANIDELYQASNRDCAVFNIYVNQSGIFMGDFSVTNAKDFSHYQYAIVEFCHPDATKTDGYMLLARQQIPLDELLNAKLSYYLPFLNTAVFNEEIDMDMIITFVGEDSKSIVMKLTRGVS